MRSLLLTTLVLVAAAAAEPQPDPVVLAQLQTMVPAGWWQAPEAIAPERDAWPAIVAMKLKTISTEDGPLWDAFMAGTIARRSFSVEQAQLLSDWLAGQSEVLPVIGGASPYAGLIRPEPGRTDRWLGMLRDLSKRLILDARIHATRHETGPVWVDVIALMRLDDWASRAALTPMDDLVAIALESSACTAIARLALDAPDAEGMRAVLARLPADRSVDIPAILRRAIASPDNVRGIAKSPVDGPGWAKILMMNSAFGVVFNALAKSDDGDGSPSDPRRDFGMVSAQARIFDGLDAFRLEIAWCDEVTRAAPESWVGLQRILVTPAGQSLKIRCGAAADVFDVGIDWPRLYPSLESVDQGEVDREREQAMDALRKLLLDDPDPFGALTAAEYVAMCAQQVEHAFDLEARRRLARTAMAVALARLDTGVLPGSLLGLVSAGLVDAVPVDPFNGEPLHYDAAKGLLWSVGKDLVDDGGERKKDIMVEVKSGAVLPKTDSGH